MNPGTFQGASTGVPIGSISRYIQTPTIQTSQTIAVPPGTQRIEALLCGGGGGGNGTGGLANFNIPGGGGFGGAAILEIPITGAPLQVVIGAGGSPGVSGSPTYIVSAGTRYAEVGGGGYGSYGGAPAGSGRSGGGGGGGGSGNDYTYAYYYPGGNGGSPPIGKLIWSIYPQDSLNNINGTGRVIATYPPVYQDPIGQIASPYYYVPTSSPSGAGIGGGNFGPSGGNDGRYCAGTNGSFGGGGGGGGAQYNMTSAYAIGPGYGGGGGGGYNSGQGTPGNWGGGGAASNQAAAHINGSGGSLTSVSIWGYTGFAGGTKGATYYSGGGGGLLGAGANGSSTQAANGGNGGGGGGGAQNPSAGSGGNGFAAIRFYL